MPTWIAYAPARREFEARDACADLGVTAIVPRKVELIRSGKRRFPDPVVSPVLPNYIGLDLSDDDWHKVTRIPSLRLTMMACGPGDWRRFLNFADIAEDAYDLAMAQIAAGQRVTEFSEGDAIAILGGPLAGQLAAFRRIVERAEAAFPLIGAELNIMGRSVLITLDPVLVRKA